MVRALLGRARGVGEAEPGFEGPRAHLGRNNQSAFGMFGLPCEPRKFTASAFTRFCFVYLFLVHMPCKVEADLEWFEAERRLLAKASEELPRLRTARIEAIQR